LLCGSGFLFVWHFIIFEKTKKSINMPNKTNEERKKMRDEMLDMMFKKANLSKDKIIEVAYAKWINNNLDLLTKADIKKYEEILLTKK
jgi:hypothetical protein